MNQTSESNVSRSAIVVNRRSKTNLLNLNSSNSLTQAVLGSCPDCGQDPCDC